MISYLQGVDGFVAVGLVVEGLAMGGLVVGGLLVGDLVVGGLVVGGLVVEGLVVGGLSSIQYDSTYCSLSSSTPNSNITIFYENSSTRRIS